MKKTIILIFVLFTAFKCFSQINSYLISDNNIKLKENAILYYLPRISLNVDIEIETEYNIPGPFSKYADKYLSIKDASCDKTLTYKITDIQINEVVEPDPNACFILVDKKFTYNVSLNNLGILSGYRKDMPSEDIQYRAINVKEVQAYKDEVIFTDYSVKSNFIEKTDTTYKVIQVDSVFQKIPIYNDVSTSKSFEQKAEEAANYIIKVRKRRFKLQSGQFETDYPIEDVELLINELKELEQKYIELFIGKKISYRNTYSFVHTPVKSGEIEKLEMCYLSEELGIVNKPEADSKPIYLIIEAMNITDVVEDFYKSQPDINNKNIGLYYRTPGHADVSVEYDAKTYINKHTIIPQYGYLNYLPSKAFSNKKLRAIFDENNGSLKRISDE